MDFRSAADFEKINQAIETAAKKEYAKDDRIWQPDVGKDGNGYAVIRFLPPAPVDGQNGVPFVQVYSYSFKGPTGQWYIENSLYTPSVNQPDPVGEYNQKRWNENTEEAKADVRRRALRKNFYSNIYVIEDPLHPENNGKVFLYRYGVKLFEKIEGAMKPRFAQDRKINPFDMTENGATFRLRIKTIKTGNQEHRNYDDSSFDPPGPLMNDYDKLNEIWQQEYSLLEFISPDKFKSYDDLKARFDLVMGFSGNSGNYTISENPSHGENRVHDVDDEIPFITNNQPMAQQPVSQPSQPASNVSKDDDPLEYYRKLAASS